MVQQTVLHILQVINGNDIFYFTCHITDNICGGEDFDNINQQSWALTLSDLCLQCLNGRYSVYYFHVQVFNSQVFWSASLRIIVPLSGELSFNFYKEALSPTKQRMVEEHKITQNKKILFCCKKKKTQIALQMTDDRPKTPQERIIHICVKGHIRGVILICFASYTMWTLEVWLVHGMI